MGTGKTAVGRLLARRLGREWVDTDALVERRHGPIPEIFEHRGEQGFRAAEREVARELSGRPDLVVSTGGRFLLDPVNAELMARHGVAVCLRASADTLVERLLVDGTAHGRPLLAGPDPAARIAELLAERSAAYAAFPGVDTDGRDVDQVADAVLALVDTR